MRFPPWAVPAQHCHGHSLSVKRRKGWQCGLKLSVPLGRCRAVLKPKSGPMFLNRPCCQRFRLYVCLVLMSSFPVSLALVSTGFLLATLKFEKNPRAAKLSLWISTLTSALPTICAPAQSL
eukprot:6459268-Amphidinium_carterae.1